MCSWLHVAWSKVKEMKSKIMKGWVKIGITRTFMTKFQLVTRGQHYYIIIHNDSKHKGAIGRKSKCRPYNSHINNHGRMFAR